MMVMFFRSSSCRGKGRVCQNRSVSFISAFCRTWPSWNLPYGTRPSKTLHSWQRIIAEQRIQRRDPSLRFRLHPLCPTRGNNKSTSLLFFPFTSSRSRRLSVWAWFQRKHLKPEKKNTYKSASGIDSVWTRRSRKQSCTFGAGFWNVPDELEERPHGPHWYTSIELAGQTPILGRLGEKSRGEQIPRGLSVTLKQVLPPPAVRSFNSPMHHP